MGWRGTQGHASHHSQRDHRRGIRLNAACPHEGPRWQDFVKRCGSMYNVSPSMPMRCWFHHWIASDLIWQNWACSSFGRALPWHGRGGRFDPDQVHYNTPSSLRATTAGFFFHSSHSFIGVEQFPQYDLYKIDLSLHFEFSKKSS